MLGGGGNPQAWWDVAGSARVATTARARRAGVAELAQGNDWLGVRLGDDRRAGGRRVVGPDRDVSNSEAGFERVYQGSALLLSWPVELAPGGRWSATIAPPGARRVDRAVEEAAGSSHLAVRPQECRQPAACAPTG